MKSRACLMILLLTLTAFAQNSALPKLEKFDASMVDKNVDPCANFYKYTCNTWTAAHPIPPDLASMSSAHPLYLYNQTILRNALDAAAANKSAKGNEAVIGAFWQSCMDEKGRDANGRAWLRPHLAEVESLKSTKDLARVIAYMHLNFPSAWQGDDNETAAPIFGFGPTQDLEDAQKVVAGLDQGGMALPALDYYLSDDAHMKELREKYVAHVQKMFELAGDAPAKAAAEAKVVLEMETAFAKASMDNVTRRDPIKIYNKRSLVQIKAAAPSFAWDDYLTRLHSPTVPFYIVSTPAFLEAIEAQIKTRSVSDWQAYLRWWTIHRSASSLGREFQDANFAYFGTALSGTPQMLPLWRRCVGSVDNYLGEALGEAYVKIAFPPAAKQRANDLVSHMRAALDAEIKTLDWMSDATKKEALKKEAATLPKIGYPDHFRDYSSVKTVADNYLAGINAANAFEFHRQIAKIGKPIDRQEWSMTPATINAYEDGQMNTINFPAGILQSPFFNASSRDDVSDYGAIGAVIGHEMIHGFDDQGRKFDDKGNLRDWWLPEDGKRYDERDKCITDQYSQEIPEYKIKTKGELTAGEDTADNGGLHIAMQALEGIFKAQGKSLDAKDANGFTPRQKFFMAYAFSWCETTRPEAERSQIVSNPHSLPRFRVNNAVSNMKDFQQAFGCKVGAPMVHAPVCRVW